MQTDDDQHAVCGAKRTPQQQDQDRLLVALHAKHKPQPDGHERQLDQDPNELRTNAQHLHNRRNVHAASLEG